MPDQSQKQHIEQTQDLHQIQQQVTRLDSKVDHLDTKVDQILYKLTGNELDKESGGMIKQVNKLEIRVESLEKFRYTLYVIVAVCSILGGYGFWDVMHKVFNK